MDDSSEASEIEPRTRSALEWELLLERLASRCTSAPGATALRGIAPEPALERAQRRTAETRDAVQLFDRGEPLPGADFPELGELLGRLRIGATASGRELFGLCRVLEQAQALRRFARAHRESHPALCEAITSPATLDELHGALSGALEADGTLSDRASPELRAARVRVREIEADIKRRLQRLVHRYAELLQEQYYTERDGRYVLPVRAEIGRAHV